MSKKIGIRNYEILSVKNINDTNLASDKTIYKFVGEGMPILCKNPILILGYDLKQHKKAKKRKSLGKVEYNEFYCKNCKTYHLIPDDKIKVIKSGKFYRNKPQLKLVAKCPVSGKKLNKFHSKHTVTEENNIGCTSTVTISNIRTIKKTHIMEFRPTGENAKVLYRFYRVHCIHARGYSTGTIAKIETAIQHYIVSAQNISFKLVTVETVIQFKSYLKKLKNRDKPISLETVKEYLHYVSIFFEYLMYRPGYKSRITYEMLQCFNLPRKEQNYLRTRRNRTVKFPTIEQVEIIVDSIKPVNVVERSHRAMLSLLVLAGLRRGELASLRLHNWNSMESRLYLEIVNDPKNGTYREVSVARINEKLYDIFTSYIDEIMKMDYKREDPIFPKAVPRKEGNDLCFVKSTELSRDFMKKKNVSRIVKNACVNAGYPDFSAHKLRHTYDREMKSKIPNMDLAVALMMNMGHKRFDVTAFSYGAMSREKQHKLIMEHFSKDPKEIPSNVDIETWENYLKFMEFEEYRNQKKKK